MKHKLSKITLFILCAVLSAVAQTSADLKTKFGKTLEAFEVRPNVLMTVEYATNGQILEIIIEPRHTERTEKNKNYNVLAFSSL